MFTHLVIRHGRKFWPVVFVLGTTPAVGDPPAAPAETRSIADRIGELKPLPSDAADSPLRKLQKERFNARLGAAKIQLATVRAGAGSRLDMTVLVDRMALNGAELEDKPSERVKWFQLRLDALREQEQMAKSRANVGGIIQMDAFLVAAARADAEIDLLQLTELVNEKK